MERFEEDSNINPARRDLIRSVITQQPSSPLRKRPYADDWDAEAQKRPREENRVRTTVRNRSWINPELKRKGMMDSRFSNKKSHVYVSFDGIPLTRANVLLNAITCRLNWFHP